MTQRITLLHTVPTLAAQFRAMVLDRLPDVQIDDVVMEQLLQRTIAEGHLSDRTAQELSAALEDVAPDTDAVLVTCSSLGPLVDRFAPEHEQPILRVDEPMARRAVALGSRVGVLATLSTTLEPTTELIERTARDAGRDVEILPHLCEGAFAAVRDGDTDRHDELVRDGLTALLDRGVDVIVLAQASMARVVDTLPSAPAVPVLASPPLAVDHLIELLERQRPDIDGTR